MPITEVINEYAECFPARSEADYDRVRKQLADYRLVLKQLDDKYTAEQARAYPKTFVGEVRMNIHDVKTHGRAVELACRTDS
jgi:hypothetical protein